jgi:hypothetical protein
LPMAAVHNGRDVVFEIKHSRPNIDASDRADEALAVGRAC